MRKRHEDRKYPDRDEVGSRCRGGQWRGVKQYTARGLLGNTPALAVGQDLTTLHVLQLAVMAGGQGLN